MSDDDDVPMPVKVAADKCFPFGGATRSTLLQAIRDGELSCERIGRGYYFVTKRDIELWRKASRVEVKPTRPRAAVKPGLDHKEATEQCLRNAERLKKGLPIG